MVRGSTLMVAALRDLSMCLTSTQTTRQSRDTFNKHFTHVSYDRRKIK
jgi:hypothetical protein